MRTMGLESAAKADLAVSSKATVDMISAYTAGVNAFINTTATLPVEYRLLGTGPDSWEPWHCIAVYKVRNMLMGSYEGKLWRARLTQMLGPEESAKLFLAYPDDSLVCLHHPAMYLENLHRMCWLSLRKPRRRWPNRERRMRVVMPG